MFLGRIVYYARSSQVNLSIKLNPNKHYTVILFEKLSRHILKSM